MSSGSLPTLIQLGDCQQTIESSLCKRITGTVDSVVGHRIEVRGMNVPIGSICQITTGYDATGIAKVIGFSADRPVLSVLDEIPGVGVGDPVQMLSTSLQIGVGKGLLGRVVDAVGRPIDGKELPVTDRFPCEVTPPSSLDRIPIDQVFETGVRAIDAFLTCGVGQRLGIFSGAGIGKSTLLGMLARCRADAIVIGMVGERGREVREFLEDTLDEASRQHSTIVVSTNDQPAAMRIQAAWTATALASALRREGKHVVLLIDSITRFAMAQRELGLAAGEPPTTRGYTPSVFAQLPKLVEQAGKTNDGAITAFYSVLVEGDDTTEPISDALRGLLDGHIVLTRSLAEQGHFPAIDVLQSLSRLQTKLLDRDAVNLRTRIRELLAVYRANEDLINIGAYQAGSNAQLDEAVQKKDALRALLTQHPEDSTDYRHTEQQLLSIASGPT